MMTVIYATLLMAACVYGITLILPGDFLKLLIGGTAGIGVYLAVAYLMKMQELYDIKEMIQTIFLKKLINKNTESPV